MAKYSTGGGGGSDEGSSCELCGAQADSLQAATIAGASLSVCSSCAPHDDRGPASGNTKSSSADSERSDPGRRAAQHAAKIADARKGDPSHWEQHGTNYEDDPLPYLISGYGDRLRESRQDAGLTTEELAEELEIDIGEIEALEQQRAARAGVGGSVVHAIEDLLEVDLTE